MQFVIEPLEPRRLLSGGGVFSHDLDIGSPDQSGSLAYAAGTYTMTAGGADIGGASDQFHFAYSSYPAAAAVEGSIVANVRTIANTNASAKAGVMFRSSTAADAAFAGIFVTPGSNVTFITRSSDGGTGGQTVTFGGAPRYLRLTRAGDQIAAFHSSDAVTWSQLGSSQTVNLGANALVGLAATSHNVSTATTATFANVSLLLPAGWSANDIGISGGTPGGFAEYDPSDNTFSVSGSGADIGGSGDGGSDQIAFTSRTMSGGGSVVARVDPLVGAANPSARAGVMIRDSLAAGAIFASATRTAQGQLVFQWRTSSGGAVSSVSIAGVAGPVWLKLAHQQQQTGSIGAFYSIDNASWIPIGAAQPVAMSSAAALAGLAVASHDNATLALATFSSVSIVQTGWRDADVGRPTLRGSATYDAAADTYTLRGSGAGLFRSSSSPIARSINAASPTVGPIAGAAPYDQFHFAARDLSGDGSVIAYVNALSGTSAQIDPWALGGLMIRADASSAAAAFAGVFVSARSGLVFEWRPAGATAVRRQVVVPATGLIASPVALKLTRAGDSFLGYYSADGGATWLPVGSAQTVIMPAAASAGIAVTSNDNTSLASATFTGVTIAPAGSKTAPGAGVFSAADQLLLNDIQQRAVQFFYNETNASTGLTPDSSNANGGGPSAFSSIAAVGFGLTALTIADQRGWLSHAAAYQRALTTINFLWTNAAQFNGFFYHFLNPATGARFGNSELSPMDTALLMAGVVNAGQYWSGTPLQTVANNVFDRVNWPWMQRPTGQFYGAWTPESGFSSFSYSDFSEAVLIYLLGLGSSTHPISASSWNSWSRTPVINYNGFTFVTAGTRALFTVQYPQAWFDLRGRTDSFGLNYYVNSQTATLAQRQMAINLAGTYPHYGANLWGFTAADGPNGYTVWGGPPPTSNIDGSVVPTGPGGSLAFTPLRSIEALRHMQQAYGSSVYRKYGFVDAFNPQTSWTSALVLGIDQGMMLLAAENARGGSVWDVFSQTPIAQQAMSRAFGTGVIPARAPLSAPIRAAGISGDDRRDDSLIDLVE